MTSVYLKPFLTILLIINSLASNFAQQKGRNNKNTSCDTLILKNGAIQFVKIAQIGKDSISFYDCSANIFDFSTKIAYLQIVDIETIKRRKETSPTPAEVQKPIPTKQKYYIEGLFDLTLPVMSALFVKTGLLPKNVRPSVLGGGVTVSAGYQFKPYLGLGVTAKSYLLFDYSSWKMRSLLADYRFDFGKTKVSLHGGFVSTNSYFASEGCDIQVDKTRSRPAYALSVKRYSPRHFVYGFGLSYLQIPTDEKCTTIQGTQTEIKNYKNAFEAHFSIGLYGPSRFKRVN